ncbi:MAG: helix-turn-helix transcriptional regulator [Spirochaetaceae bacterium]|jgi:transcriptional regulator with XRE-family HTH domain|nr:helix-turn-helix transcriptional regulator [Spirochaetaceae bacterium]
MNEKDLRAILSINLKRYRNFRKFTQAEFAEKINISIPFLSDIENGKKWVSPKTLVRMANVLDIEAYELLKPEKILPDNVGNIIEKYTDDIHFTFGKMLEKVCADYLKKLPKK